MGPHPMDFYNQGVDAAQTGDYARAISLYERALSGMGEGTDNDCCWKAATHFNCGLAILDADGMNEDTLPPWTENRMEAVARARKHWNAALGLLSRVRGKDPSDAQMSEEMRRGIMKHRFMRGPLRFTFGLDLAERNRKEEARDMLEGAVRDLRMELPDDAKMLRVAHIRLAALCNDTGRKAESVEHARYVLRNFQDLDQGTKTMMEICGGEL
jgi:tetratricopeptide (TPR) repeat protein